ncbi:hypothetical protein HHI36_013357 [Cryptolaemus montrouzieri]|uniref:BTB domain-containing protein n=1 Tax=Cryptolaemus montrouzieri TaxID=559131 RepID=A0ABD2NGV6_9CUCU
MSEKQVRVDNWGIFFLQRLQLFFSKTDYCDLTLQFEGNVQLKVHRLVLNACTEYFEVLEQSDRLIDENVLLMPEMLQADVVVPIINFMYTGMLEYPMGLYHKLYQAADLMHMTVLTKLLDAQRQQPIGLNKSINKQKVKPVKSIQNTLGLTSSPIISQSKRIPSKNSLTELPSTLPGRKLPVWKRKTVPHTSISSSFSHSDSKTKFNQKLENAAKPTRFEWPDDDLDLPQPDAMDLSDFGDISYTSKPLLREDDVKPILQIKSEPNKSQSVKKELHEITTEETSDVENVNRTFAEKRKQLEDLQIDKSPKKLK